MARPWPTTPGNVAAFAASDRARSMTATTLNITCGSQPD